MQKSVMKEQHKYKKILKKMSKITLYITRRDKDGNLQNSAPCNDCIETIKYFNIKKIVYTCNDDGNIEICKPCNYEVNHISLGRQYLNNRFLNF